MKQSARIMMLAGVLALGLTSSAWSQEASGSTSVGTETSKEDTPARETRNVRAATSEIRIDAELDEPAWQEALRIPVAYEWAPGDNSEPPVRTDCLVTFDDENLYVAFQAHDPDPSQMRVNLADRDTAFTDDTVGFLIDPFNGERLAYEFRVNPRGVQMDGTLTDVGNIALSVEFWSRIDYDGKQDWSWDAIWDSAGKVTADGYVAEIAVPFRQLRFPSTEDIQTWGFLATRHFPRQHEHQIRSARRDFDRNCQVCQFDKIAGFEGISRGLNLEIAPTVTSSRDESLVGAGSEEDDTEAGLFVRWGVTPNVTLNATVNPDFSQVEADVAQLDVNERFVLFFPEKRPFFLEDSNFFDTLQRAIYTRTIADPKIGLKVTGQQGKNSYGILYAEDRLNNLLFPTFQSSFSGSVDQDVSTGILRYRRDLGKVSSLGFLYTGREADGYHNHVYGIDGRFEITDSDALRVQYLRSDTRYPDQVVQNFGQPEGSFDGNSFEVRWDHETRDVYVFGRLRSIDKSFRADSGFFRQVDKDEFSGIAVKSWWGDADSWFTRLAVQLDYIVANNTDGFRFDEGANLTLIWEGARQTLVQAAFRPNWETFQGVDFYNYRSDVYVSLRPTKRIELESLLRFGETIDFANVRQSDFVHFRQLINFKLGLGFSGSLSHDFQEFRIPEGVFQKANLTQTTLYYHFNRRTFVRAIGQYRDVERVPELFNGNPNPKVQSLLTQGLFSYEINPRTAVLLGYSDNYRGTATVDFDQTNRTYFLKLAYSWLR